MFTKPFCSPPAGDTLTITCYTCGMPSSNDWAQRVRTRTPSGNGTPSKPYYPFICALPPPAPSALLMEDGSTFLCAFCHASLEAQWKTYERPPPSDKSDQGQALIRPRDRKYSVQKFICSVCAVVTYRKRVRALPFQEFPFLAKERQPGSLTLGDNPWAVVCLDCSETLWAQSAEYDRWGLPVQKRHFNWMARPPPPEDSMEATVARLPSGETQLPRCPPTEPPFLPFHRQKQRKVSPPEPSNMVRPGPGPAAQANGSPQNKASSPNGRKPSVVSSHLKPTCPPNIVIGHTQPPVVTVAPMTSSCTTTTSVRKDSIMSTPGETAKYSGESPATFPVVQNSLHPLSRSSVSSERILTLPSHGAHGSPYNSPYSWPGGPGIIHEISCPPQSLEPVPHPAVLGVTPWPWLSSSHPNEMLRYQTYLSSLVNRRFSLSDSYFIPPPSHISRSGGPPTSSENPYSTNFSSVLPGSVYSSGPGINPHHPSVNTYTLHSGGALGGGRDEQLLRYRPSRSSDSKLLSGPIIVERPVPGGPSRRTTTSAPSRSAESHDNEMTARKKSSRTFSVTKESSRERSVSLMSTKTNLYGNSENSRFANEPKTRAFPSEHSCPKRKIGRCEFNIDPAPFLPQYKDEHHQNSAIDLSFPPDPARPKKSSGNSFMIAQLCSESISPPVPTVRSPGAPERGSVIVSSRTVSACSMEKSSVEPPRILAPDMKESEVSLEEIQIPEEKGAKRKISGISEASSAEDAIPVELVGSRQSISSRAQSGQSQDHEVPETMELETKGISSSNEETQFCLNMEVKDYVDKTILEFKERERREMSEKQDEMLVKSNFLLNVGLITPEQKTEVELEVLSRRADQKTLPLIRMRPSTPSIQFNPNPSVRRRSASSSDSLPSQRTRFQTKQLQFLKQLKLDPISKAEKSKREIHRKLILMERSLRERRSSGPGKTMNEISNPLVQVSELFSGNSDKEVHGDTIPTLHQSRSTCNTAAAPSGLGNILQTKLTSSEPESSATKEDSPSSSISTEPVIKYPKYEPALQVVENLENLEEPCPNESHMVDLNLKPKLEDALKTNGVTSSDNGNESSTLHECSVPDPTKTLESESTLEKNDEIQTSDSKISIGLGKWNSTWKELREQIETLVMRNALEDSEVVPEHPICRTELRLLRNALISRQAEIQTVEKNLEQFEKKLFHDI